MITCNFFPQPNSAEYAAIEQELGLRVALALDDENNCQDAWMPCWCERCHPVLSDSHRTETG